MARVEEIIGAETSGVGIKLGTTNSSCSIDVVKVGSREICKLSSGDRKAKDGEILKAGVVLTSPLCS